MTSRVELQLASMISARLASLGQLLDLFNNVFLYGTAVDECVFDLGRREWKKRLAEVVLLCHQDRLMTWPFATT